MPRIQHGTSRRRSVLAVYNNPDICPKCGGRLASLGTETDMELRHDYWQCMSCGQTGCANFDVTDGSFLGHFIDG